MSKIELQVIDLITINTDVLSEPGRFERYGGEGKLLVIDQSVHKAQELPIRTPATMKLGNGDEVVIIISSVSQKNGGMAIFLKDYSGPEITRGTTISWNV